MVVDFDDMGANRVISDQCQSHDCRDKLDALHYANPNFKVTLFTIPAYMTMELAEWCSANSGWVELAIHGYNHNSNYECEKMSYEEFDEKMNWVKETWGELFVKGFKAPGWQISDDIYRWLNDHGWWVADQGYNNDRRPQTLRAYINNNGSFHAWDGSIAIPVEAWHGHTWDCVGNGIYETFDHVKNLVEKAESFQFVSEVLS